MKMLLQSVKLIGKEHKVSQKGNKYDVILIADGTDTMQLMVNQTAIKFDDIQEDSRYNILVQTSNYGGRTSFSMIEMLEV